MWYSDFVELNDAWSTKHYSKLQQQGEDLGQRLQFAFSKALKSSDKVIVIGTDCPRLTPEHILSAEKALDYIDIVIGPAMDGGYYLLGMKNSYKELFKDIDWSSDRVLHQTLQKIGKLKLSCKLLEELSDIDYIEDWEKFGWKL